MVGQHATALQIIDEVITVCGLSDGYPRLLHHYTSVDVGLKILETKDLWLVNAEYLNDASEIRGAQNLMLNGIKLERDKTHMRRQEDFLNDVDLVFRGQARMYEAFVFCMSEIPIPPPRPRHRPIKTCSVRGARMARTERESASVFLATILSPCAKEMGAGG
jgi:hypothetical protein